MLNRIKNIYILTSIIYLFAASVFFTRQTYVAKLVGILFFVAFILNVRLALKKAHESH